MVNITFNTKKLIQYKNSSYENWKKHNFIFKKFAEHFFIKVNEIKNDFENILLLTSDFNEILDKIIKFQSKKIIFQSQFDIFLEKIQNRKNIAKVYSKFENLEYKEESFDLIIHNFSLNNLNNINDHLQKIFTLLNKDGLFICNFFGSETLNELRNSLLITDNKLFDGAYVRMSPGVNMVNIVDLMGKVGFKEIVSEVVNYQVFYEKLNDLLIDIKGVGENTVFEMVSKGLKTKNYFKTLEETYFENYSVDKKIISTCDVVSITCWK